MDNPETLTVNVVGSSKFGRYKKISDELTINMFISDGFLVNFPGYQRVLELLESGQGRGAFVSTRGNFMLLVVNANVYRISQSFAITLIGSLSTYQGKVTMDENLNNQICIVDGTAAYIYNHSLPSNLTKCVDHSSGSDPTPIDSGALIPNYVVYHNTFFLFGNANTTGDGAAWYVYEFDSDFFIRYRSQQSLQTKPDYALAVVRLPGQANNVLVMGKNVSEIHTQIGSPTEYTRNRSINIDYGTINVDTIAASDSHIAWLGINESNSPAIMVFTGQSLNRISTDGIDNLMGRLVNPSLSTATFFRKDGHLFYVLTFYDPRDNLTVCYDFNTEQFFNLSDQHLNYFPARQIVYFNQSTYFVSINNGSLYKFSSDITVYNENISSTQYPEDINQVHAIQRIRICEPIRKSDSSKFIASVFEFTVEQGYDEFIANLYETILVDETGKPILSQGNVQIVPEFGVGGNDGLADYVLSRVDMAISRDGGHTYSSYVKRDFNRLAHRQNILNWQRLGSANDMRIKLRFWGLNRFVAGNGTVDIRV